MKTGEADLSCRANGEGPLLRAGVQRGAAPLCRVQGDNACAECRGGEPLLRCPEVENLGPGKVDALRQLILGIT